MPADPQRIRTRRRRLVAALGLVVAVVVLWHGWAERYPQEERKLRVLVQDQLQANFPAAMRPAEDRYGIFPRVADMDAAAGAAVLLVHGLDEPGTIWDDLVPALGTARVRTWEFRYPNDQGIDRSADLLASRWPDLPAEQPVVLLGHSMGGLVIRDFVSRWRHPVETTPRVNGAAVAGVILAGTPNQGSEWARLRVWLELRDHWATARDTGFAPLAALQDGTGAAKIDLQPGSDFLDALNTRPWPEAVAVRIIGGILWSASPALGDGVVATGSLTVDGAPAPVLVGASHRGMLLRMFESDPEPPAIPAILTLLEEFHGAN